MKLVVASDHAAFDMAEVITASLTAAGHDVARKGASSIEAYDYPIAADDLCGEILAGNAEFGILLCGTGIGVSIRANRHLGIRAALCTSPEMARLARQHNHANVLCLGARILTIEQAVSITETFLVSAESHEGRHENRVSLLDRNVSC